MGAAMQSVRTLLMPALTFRVHDGDGTFSQNNSKFFPDYSVLHTTRLCNHPHTAPFHGMKYYFWEFHGARYFCNNSLAISILSCSNQYVDIQLTYLCHCTMSNSEDYLQFGSVNVNFQWFSHSYYASWHYQVFFIYPTECSIRLKFTL